MANLTLLGLAFAALVAFATAHTTTIQDENPFSEDRQCSQRLQGQRLNQCRMFLQQQGQIPYNWGRQQQQPQQQQQQEMLEQCCEELQNVEEQCQCEAVKQVFREAQQEEQQQQGPYGSQQTQRLRQKAEILPNVCNLQSRQCRIGNIITTVTESNIDVDRPFGRRSQQCRESEIQRPVNQCQRYVEQQMQTYQQQQQQQQPGRRQQQHQQQRPEGLEECCNELQNVERECQCQAVEEVARRVIRQPQQQQQRHQQQQQGRQQQQQMDIARRVIQNLPNQCNLEVRQCSNIPYGMI